MIMQGPVNADKITEWQGWLRERYPKTHRARLSGNAFFGIFDEAFTLALMSSGSFSYLLEVVDDRPIGLISYQILPQPERISVLGFAVLPEHQGNGIGARLLEELKKLASLKYPIFAGGLLEPSIRPLERAGFRPADLFMGKVVYKWSDMPEHDNNDVPGSDKDTGWSDE